MGKGAPRLPIFFSSDADTALSEISCDADCISSMHAPSTIIPATIKGTSPLSLFSEASVVVLMLNSRDNSTHTFSICLASMRRCKIAAITTAAVDQLWASAVIIYIGNNRVVSQIVGITF